MQQCGLVGSGTECPDPRESGEVVGWMFGFCVPLLFPLAATSLALHATVFRVAVTRFGIEMTRHVRPPLQYLWLALCIGWGLVAWFFFAAQLHGRWLVLIGAPLASLLAGVAAVRWCRLHSDRGRATAAAPSGAQTISSQQLRELYPRTQSAIERMNMTGSNAGAAGVVAEMIASSLDTTL